MVFFLFALLVLVQQHNTSRVLIQFTLYIYIKKKKSIFDVGKRGTKENQIQKVGFDPISLVMRNIQRDNYFNLVLFTSQLYFYWSIVF